MLIPFSIRSDERLHLSFQCVCEQHPDTGRMLMPSVNAATDFIKNVLICVLKMNKGLMGLE